MSSQEGPTLAAAHGRMIQRLARLGTWAWDVARDEVEWSDETLAMLGLDRASFGGTLEEVEACIHPEDRARWRADVEACLAEGRAHDLEFRVCRADGSERTVAAMGEVEVGPDGAPARMLGVLFDVTEGRRAEAELRRSAERFASLMQQTSEGLRFGERAGPRPCGWSTRAGPEVPIAESREDPRRGERSASDLRKDVVAGSTRTAARCRARAAPPPAPRREAAGAEAPGGRAQDQLARTLGHVPSADGSCLVTTVGAQVGVGYSLPMHPRRRPQAATPFAPTNYPFLLAILAAVLVGCSGAPRVADAPSVPDCPLAAKGRAIWDDDSRRAAASHLDSTLASWSPEARDLILRETGALVDVIVDEQERLCAALASGEPTPDLRRAQTCLDIELAGLEAVVEKVKTGTADELANFDRAASRVVAGAYPCTRSAQDDAMYDLEQRGTRPILEQLAVSQLLQDLGAPEADAAHERLATLLDEPAHPGARIRAELLHAFHQDDLDASIPRVEGLREQARAAQRPSEERLATNFLAVLVSWNGDDERSLELHREALELGRAEGNVMAEAVELFNIAFTLRDTGAFEEAKVTFDRARAAYEQHQPLLVGDVLFERGRLHDRAAEHEAATAAYRESLAAYRKLHGERHPAVADAHLYLAFARQREGEREEAHADLERGLEVTKATFGEEHSRTANAYFELGRSLRKLSRPEKELEAFRNAVAIRKRIAKGPDAPTATALLWLGTSLNHLGRYDEASPHLEAAAEIRSTLEGDEHPSVAEVLHHQAFGLAQAGRLDRAEQLARRVLAIRRAAFDEIHLEVAKGYNLMGIVYGKKNEFDQAQAAYEKALAVSLQLPSQPSSWSAQFLENLAHLASKRGDVEEASRLLRRAIDIHASASGEQSRAVAKSYVQLAMIQREHDQDERVAESLEAAIAIEKAQLGARHARVAKLLHWRALHLYALQRYRQSLHDYEEAAAIGQEALGPEAEATLRSQAQVGLVRAVLGDHAAALEAYEAAWAGLRKALGEAHPSTLDSLFGIGLSLQELGRNGDALEHFQRLAATASKETSSAHRTKLKRFEAEARRRIGMLCQAGHRPACQSAP